MQNGILYLSALRSEFQQHLLRGEVDYTLEENETRYSRTNVVNITADEEKIVFDQPMVSGMESDTYVGIDMKIKKVFNAPGAIIELQGSIKLSSEMKKWLVANKYVKKNEHGDYDPHKKIGVNPGNDSRWPFLALSTPWGDLIIDDTITEYLGKTVKVMVEISTKITIK